jgi:hypothetical protein
MVLAARLYAPRRGHVPSWRDSVWCVPNLCLTQAHSSPFQRTTPSAALLPQRIFTRNYGDQGLGHRRRHRRDRLGYRFGE